MKIVSIADKTGSAIDRLCKMNIARLPHITFDHFCVHPKRPDPAVVDAVRRSIRNADLIDFGYWKSAVLLRRLIPEIEKIPMILTHNNEHNINDDKRNHWEWQEMAWPKIIVKNKWQLHQLEAREYKPHLIRHAFEAACYSFVPQLTQERVVGYVGQIKKVKGVRELKAACDKLGYRLIVVGGASEAAYWDELKKDNVEFLNNIPDEELGAIYHRMRVFVCNSDDGTESGTLPVLEAMASGIPVVSRLVGHVRDFAKDGSNIIVNNAHYTDVDVLAAKIKQVMEDDALANAIREEAWRTSRQYHPDIHAREYEKVYYQVLYPNEPSVSVIMPTCNRAQVLAENLAALAGQSYRAFEVVVCDDGSSDNTRAVVEEARREYGYAIRYIQTGNFAQGDAKPYGLAKARNMGVIDAIGKIVVLCDDRQRMHSGAIEAFVRQLEKVAKERGNTKVWAWGSKGAYKGFVENFSATYRQELINGGMFNERMDEYGGMTQEISNRFTRQGFALTWTPTAVAEALMSTHSKSNHREAIVRSKIKLYKLGMQ